MPSHDPCLVVQLLGISNLPVLRKGGGGVDVLFFVCMNYELEGPLKINLRVGLVYPLSGLPAFNSNKIP